MSTAHIHTERKNEPPQYPAIGAAGEELLNPSCQNCVEESTKDQFNALWEYKWKELAADWKMDVPPWADESWTLSPSPLKFKSAGQSSKWSSPKIDFNWINENADRLSFFHVDALAVMHMIQTMYTKSFALPTVGIDVDRTTFLDTGYVQEGRIEIEGADLCSPCSCSESDWGVRYWDQNSCYWWLSEGRHDRTMDYLKSTEGQRWLLSNEAQDVLHSSFFQEWAFLHKWYERALTSSNPDIQRLAQRLIDEYNGIWRVRDFRNWTEEQVLAWLTLLPLNERKHYPSKEYDWDQGQRFIEHVDHVWVPLFKRNKVTGRTLADDRLVTQLLDVQKYRRTPAWQLKVIQLRINELKQGGIQQQKRDVQTGNTERF